MGSINWDSVDSPSKKTGAINWDAVDPAPAAPVKLKNPAIGSSQREYSFSDRLNNFWDSFRGAVAAPLVGINQRLNRPNSQYTSDAWHEHMAEVMAKPGGVGGAVMGGAAGAAPLALIPGANTIGGSALLGGATGYAQPTQEGESPLDNAKFGAFTAAAVPAAIRAGKTVRAMAIDPFTEAGRTRIAGGVLNRVAGDDAGVVQQRLAAAQGNTPGFTPSVAQAADHNGISAFERAMRQIDPQSFNALDRSQRGAIVDALVSIAKTPEERAQAVAMRESAVSPLYDAAKKAVVPSDPVIESLIQRPIIKTALGKAEEIAKNEGRQFMLSNSTPSRTVTATDPIFGIRTQTIPGTPGEYSGLGLHDLKMGIDAAMLGPENQGLAAAQKGAQNAAKQDYLNWLESKIPEYGQARVTYADLSRPINQMDVGKAFHDRFVPALADNGAIPFKTRADAFATALRNGDSLVQSSTGMKNATLSSVMEPEQIQLLEGIKKDMAAKAAAESGGRGTGSDTVQKIAMSNIAAEAGIPTWLQNIAKVPGGWAKRAGDVLYGNADEQVRKNLGFLMTDPQAAAEAMQLAGANPSRLAEAIKRFGSAAAFTAIPARTALSAE